MTPGKTLRCFHAGLIEGFRRGFASVMTALLLTLNRDFRAAAQFLVDSDIKNRYTGERVNAVPMNAGGGFRSTSFRLRRAHKASVLQCHKGSTDGLPGPKSLCALDWLRILSVPWRTAELKPSGGGVGEDISRRCGHAAAGRVLGPVH